MNKINWIKEHFFLIWLGLFAIFVVAVVLLVIREYSFVQNCNLCVAKGFCYKAMPIDLINFTGA